MIENRVVRAGIGVTALFTLAGCGLAEGLTASSTGHVKTVGYDTGAAGKNNDDTRLPAWMPDEARSISEAIRTTGTERVLRMRLDDPALLDSCHASPSPAKPPTLPVPWWPTDEHTKATLLCDSDWYVSLEGTTVYAYRPETVPQSSQ